MLTPQHAAIRLLKLMMVASLVLPALLFSFAAWVSYRNTEKVADERIERSLDILHEHALKVFQTVERTFAEIQEILRGTTDIGIANNEAALHERLKKIVDAMPQLRGIAIISRDGHALVTSNSFPVPKDTTFADRDYFQAQKDKIAGTYISDIHHPRMGGLDAYFFTLSHRRTLPDGTFDGVISVAVLPTYFEKFYARMAHSEGDYLAMVRSDGGFLARFPVPHDRATKLGANSEFLRDISNGIDHAIFTVHSQVDYVDRRIGYRKLTGFPVYVAAGTTQSAIRAEWLTYMSSHLIFGVPVTALLFTVLWIALRRTRRLYEEAERREVAEGALRQAQRLEALGQMTGGVAHDFNNLLMVVNGSVRRLRSELTDKKYVRLLDMIATATQRGENLTRQLLTFSRRQTLTPEVIDLSQRLPMLKELLARSLRGDIEIKVEVPDEICAVRIDPGEFELAILNLAINAKDAMESGGTLSIRAKPVTLKGEASADSLRGEFVAIRIADTGAGIPSELLPRVFEPFFTTKEVGKGTGLGLSQVYGFAKQSGGTATISSAEARGTAVTLYLPRSQETPSQPSSSDRAPAQPIAAGSVLLVEDSAEVAEVSAGYLQELGYTVEIANNARGALDKLKSKFFDLVFSDILMPGGMNGLDLAREVASRYPAIPILLATGYSASAQDAVRQGFVVLQKPYNVPALKERIRLARERARARALATAPK
ncbi:MAG TPA: ATP-binding protein [Pseudolabrys sp.]|nr:ATP-binding protein [Pseudolabrys sp.]